MKMMLVLATVLVGVSLSTPAFFGASTLGANAPQMLQLAQSEPPVVMWLQYP